MRRISNKHRYSDSTSTNSSPSLSRRPLHLFHDMLINCFCAARGNQLTIDDDRPQPARRPTSTSSRTKPFRTISRQGSDGSRISSTSSCSNESISKLPPCKRDSDPKIEAMMMPLPHNERPSKCLRLSHPRIYSSIVSDMKSCKGCRDWKNFAVFYPDDVDMNITADEAAKQRAIDYQRRLRELNCSLASWPSSDRSIEVDMIG